MGGGPFPLIQLLVEVHLAIAHGGPNTGESAESAAAVFKEAKQPLMEAEALVMACRACILTGALSFRAKRTGNGPITVSESTVSNTELCEFFWISPSSGERAQ